jgi:vitamin B12 transporter
MKLIASCVRRGAPVRLCVSALAVLAAFPVLAQNQAQGTLGEVVVTATRVAVPITDVIADVSIIDRCELDLAGQSSLKDVLAFQPGVQISSNGGYRSTTGVFLRGATSSQAIVLIDGVRVGSATSGGAAFENIPLDRIERIEILRGASSALYGPDAVGGVIQIFTREPEDGLHFAASVGAGSDGQREASASIRGRDGAVGYSLGLSREKATGINLTNKPAATSYNPDVDSFDSTSMDARLTAQLSKQHALTLSLMHSETDYQFDGTSSSNPLGLTKLSTDAWIRPVLNLASLKWDAQWSPDWKSSVTLAHSDDELVSDYYRYNDGALNGSSKFNTHRTQATWQNDINLGADVLTALLETRSEDVDSSTNYAVKQRDINSVMVSYALNEPNWNALAVLRHDDNSQFGGFDNWALSGGYKLTQHWRAVASLGTSFQAPTFNQLYSPLIGNYKGDPTLTPQKNRASELGLKYQRDAISASATVYYNEIQGFIAPSTNTQSSLAVLRGVTLSLRNQVGDTSYTVSYDYADPHAQPGDVRLVRVARNVLNFNLNQRMGAFNVFGELKLSSDREDAYSSALKKNTVVLGGYSLINLGLDWKVNKELSLLTRINNLADKKYVLADGYAMPGRNAFVSLSWAM